MRLLALTTLSLTTSIFAASHISGQEETQVQNVSPLTPGYNAPFSVDLGKKYDFVASASFIFWQPIQENMKLGVLSDTSGALDLVNGNEIDLDYKYKPGFKVGIGMDFDYDNWDTFIEYTWLYGQEKVSKTLNPNNTLINILPAWQMADFLDPAYNGSSSETWSLHINLVDWDLARSYYVGTKLAVRPFMGVRAAFINQKVDVSYINTDAAYIAVWPSTFVHQSSSSWGVGPQAGLSSDWMLGGGFAIHGKGEFDILFTQYDLKSKQTSSVLVANQYIINQNNANYLRTHLELALGLGWERYFANNKSRVKLSADYSFQTFFNQNMFRRTVSTQAAGISFLPNGNLYLQGLTATVGFDF